jgi:hypothetical protein
MKIVTGTWIWIYREGREDGWEDNRMDMDGGGRGRRQWCCVSGCGRWEGPRMDRWLAGMHDEGVSGSM